MFWGVTLTSGKRYAQVVEASYHLTNAALEPPKESKKDGKKEEGQYTSLYLEVDKQDHLLGTLSGNNLQMQLNFIFVEGQEIAFFINGPGTVHLTGYILPEDEEGFDQYGDMGSEEEEVSELSDEEPIKTVAPKRKMEAVQNNSKKAKTELAPAKKNESVGKVNGKAQAEDSDDDDDDDSDEDSNEEDFSALMQQLKAARGGDEDDDDSEEDDDDDESDEEAEVAIAKAQQNKLKANMGKPTPQGQKQAPKQTPGQKNGNKQQNQPSAQKNKQPNQNKPQQPNQKSPQPNQKSPQKQQQKGNENKGKNPNQAGTPGNKPQQTPGNKQQQTPGNKGQTPFKKGGNQQSGGQNKKASPFNSNKKQGFKQGSY